MSAGHFHVTESAGMKPFRKFGSPPSTPASVTTGRNSHMGSLPEFCWRYESMAMKSWRRFDMQPAFWLSRWMARALGTIRPMRSATMATTTISSTSVNALRDARDMRPF